MEKRKKQRERKNVLLRFQKCQKKHRTGNRIKLKLNQKYKNKESPEKERKGKRERNLVSDKMAAENY